MRLFYKFFFAFCITSFVAVGLMLALITVNLSTSFNDFVNEAEHKQVVNLKSRIIAFYQENGSWELLKGNEALWKEMLGANTKSSLRAPTHSMDANKQTEDSISTLSHLLQTQKRLSLYDINKQVIIGRRSISDNPYSETIELDGEQIGWISLIPSELLEGSPGNEFLAQQYKNYYIIALSVIALALITAWLFSRHLVSPISSLINGTFTLIKGNYSIRIEKKTNDELALLSDNVNVLAETLDKNQSNRSKWMSDVSHELKTPLTILRGQLIGIQDGVFKADEQRVQLFIDQIDSMGNIVNDLYQLSTTDVGGLTYKKEPLNPIQILLQVAESFSAKFKQKELSVDCTQIAALISDEKCNVLADRDRLRQLFVNLFENAYRYTNAQGCIQINANIIEQNINIQMQDSAPGVPLTIQGHLFERFYRLEPSRNRDSGGSGLGLALCKQIVDAHQGTITTSDSSLGGLSINITLPKHRSYPQ
ncbi:ATP-binding protein [Psychromonas algicola]|uniref:ATP-binding protein n=1 Tax=Psychromonas algicola TaxID=2555642 RepID=UPI001ABB4612|nr:ATP-binding protein [Psychromonas sp. RZ5]